MRKSAGQLSGSRDVFVTGYDISNALNICKDIVEVLEISKGASGRLLFGLYEDLELQS